jgi:hypothetical protein
MNPLLPRDVFIPDAEARTMSDGRLYLYGSLDKADRDWCSPEYRVFSTDDMEHWTDHGVSFRYHKPLAAPDCAERGGLYYLYYDTGDGLLGVAVSDKPGGPFDDRGVLPVISGEGIDPSVLVDDDGSFYYFWGQYSLSGAKLNADMKSIDPLTIHRNVITEYEHGFHEGSSFRKIDGTYYLTYCSTERGNARTLCYATADNPFGPYKKRGALIDNSGCDAASWNNHGSIEMYKGRLFVFYHRSSRGTNANRRVCAEPLKMAADGSLHEVTMTTSGASCPLDVRLGLDAGSACRLRTPFWSKRKAMRIEAWDAHCEILSSIYNDDWAEYKELDFKQGITSFSIEAAGTSDCMVELLTDGGLSQGFCRVTATGGFDRWRWFECPIKTLTGVRTLWLKFHAMGDVDKRLSDIKQFRFE